ncbi:hypothetical protein ACTFXL_02885 [Pseudomonas aeruginosa]|uniref:hypothetical protein n=1 Tax=Pseudomonas aeruginosa TaxID=287 RepID=UPI003F77403C|nr:hypothetical protein [Pseudomonas aeruginosa]
MEQEEPNRLAALETVISELDRVYPDGGYDAEVWKHENGPPDFVTSRNQRQTQFTAVARGALEELAYAWTKEVPRFAIRMAQKELHDLIRQAVADLHADRLFGHGTAADLKLLDDAVNRLLGNAKTDYVHSFPAITLGMEVECPFIIGPVSIMTRTQWLDATDFSEYAKDTYLGGDEANRQWKECVLEALAKPLEAAKEGEPLPGLAAAMYEPLRTAGSLLRVALSGYEISLSQKAARQICKTALDGISLILGRDDRWVHEQSRGTEVRLSDNPLFHKQSLADDRMPPVDRHTIIESDGFLHLPGYGLSQRFHLFKPGQVRRALEVDNMRPKVDGLANILNALVSPAEHPHPRLAMRWAMALEWLAEGEREVGEAMALAKMGTSLDVLIEGGKFVGILNAISHLTGWQEGTLFKIGPTKRTLRWLVKEIYDNGRSKILHGNVFDRLQSFANTRTAAASLARLALVESAVRLNRYDGDDSSKAFRTMPMLQQ